jgi:hypothetical protein
MLQGLSTASLIQGLQQTAHFFIYFRGTADGLRDFAAQ